MEYKPPHEIKDYRKYEKLVKRMKKHGWQGAPLLADNSELLTGSHRFYAAQTAKIDLVVIDVREIIPDWDSIEKGDRRSTSYKQALYDRLTREQIQYYGLYLMLMTDKHPKDNDRWMQDWKNRYRFKQ